MINTVTVHASLFRRRMSHIQRAKQVFAGLLDHGLNVGTVFVANVVLARVETKNGFGAFVLCYSIYIFLTGIHNAFVVEPFHVLATGKFRQSLSSYLTYSFDLHTRVALWLTLALYASVLTILGVQKSFLESYIALSACLSMLLTGILLRRIYYVIPAATRLIVASMGFFVAFVVIFGIVSWYDSLDGRTTFAAMAGAWLLVSVFGLSSLRKSELLLHTADRQTTQFSAPHWKYVRWALPASVLSHFTIQSTYWLTAAMLSQAELATLRAAQTVVLPIDLLLAVTNIYLLSIQSEHFRPDDTARFLQIVRRQFVLVAAITLAGGILIVLAGDWIIHALYLGKYDDGAAILRALAFLPLVYGAGHLLNASFKASERPKLILFGYCASALTILAVAVPLIKTFGMMGVVFMMYFAGTSYTIFLFASFYWVFIRGR